MKWAGILKLFSPIEFLMFKLFNCLVLQLLFLCLCRLSIKKLFALIVEKNVKPEEVVRHRAGKHKNQTEGL